LYQKAISKAYLGMKYFFFVMLIFYGLTVLPQSTENYIPKMASAAGIKQPVPQKVASRVVRRPIKMDSISLVNFHKTYVTTTWAGSGVLIGGTLLVVSHIMIAALVPNFNRNLVITLATFGVAGFTAGGIALPLGTNEMHRYKKSLRIELAKKGL
jgi:hypothetical protein